MDDLPFKVTAEELVDRVEAYETAEEDFRTWNREDTLFKSSPWALLAPNDADLERDKPGQGFFDVEENIPPLRRSRRIKKKAQAAHVRQIVSRALPSVKGTDASRRAVSEVMAAVLTDAEPGDPGTDPSPFSPVIRSVVQTDRLPRPIGKAWVKSFVSELTGILVNRRACALEDPNPDDQVVDVMEVYRAKIDKDGLLDKLKCRVVFRGDLCDPADDMDTWNPHASFLALKIFLAFCAKYDIYPRQIDFLLAYLQANMRERVFIRFPEKWKKYLPEHLHKWIGRPVRLLKALYGYNYSGKFLYQDQADFLQAEGFEETGLPGLWVKHLPRGHKMLFLHYVDDILCASTNDVELEKFVNAMKSRFEIEAKPRADWYLQTRIQQDADHNILLDQSRYCKSMISRFLPAFATGEPSEQDAKKCASPAKTGVKFTRDDCSTSRTQVEELEQEYGFRYIELIGCFNWLSYTCYEELFVIRKLCKFMNLPGRAHFLAALHLLHHFRCHLPKPLIFYKDVAKAPIYRLYKDIPGLLDKFDPFFVVFADSAHADNDQGRSTACDLQFVQGGLVDHTSWVPNPIPMSTAESENNCYSAAAMRALFTSKAIKSLFFQDPEAPYTIPICVDSTAAMAMNSSDNPTKKTRHIASRFWFGRQAKLQGLIDWVKVNGSNQQPADPGTKLFQARESQYYRYLVEGRQSSD